MLERDFSDPTFADQGTMDLIFATYYFADGLVPHCGALDLYKFSTRCWNAMQIQYYTVLHYTKPYHTMQ